MRASVVRHGDGPERWRVQCTLCVGVSFVYGPEDRENLASWLADHFVLGHRVDPVRVRALVPVLISTRRVSVEQLRKSAGS